MLDSLDAHSLSIVLLDVYIDATLFPLFLNVFIEYVF